MKNSIISIPNPCTESWASMSPNEQGAFCSQCSTTVIDFSSMSRDETTRFLDISEKSVCGRFKVKQLNNYSQTTSGSNKEWSFNLKAVVLGASLLTFQPAFAEQNIAPLPTQHINVIFKDSIQSNQIHFLLLNSVSGEPIPFIKIILYGPRNKVLADNLSDIDGKGTINLNKIDLSKVEKIIIKSSLYETQEIAWADVNLKEINTIKMNEQEELFILGNTQIVKPQEK